MGIHSTSNKGGDASSTVLDDQQQNLVALLESEFSLLYKDALSSPIPHGLVSREQQIVESSYAPFHAFDRAVDAYIEEFFLPLVQKIIDRVSQLRLEYRIPYEVSDKCLQDCFESLALREWESAVLNAYRVACSHVIHNTGTLAEYKDKELILSKEGYLKRIPSALINTVFNLVTKAIAETNLKISQMNNINTGFPETPDRSDHPGWRLAAAIVPPCLGLIGFAVLPFLAAIIWFVITLLMIPLTMAGISHKPMDGKDFKQMYGKGIKMLPVIGKIIGARRE